MRTSHGFSYGAIDPALLTAMVQGAATLTTVGVQTAQSLKKPKKRHKEEAPAPVMAPPPPPAPSFLPWIVGGGVALAAIAFALMKRKERGGK